MLHLGLQRAASIVALTEQRPNFEIHGDERVRKRRSRQVLPQRGDAFRSQYWAAPLCRIAGFRARLARLRAIVDLWVDDGQEEAANGVIEPDPGPRARFSVTHRNPR